jgi:methyl-accepting chemotaxis protein
MGAATVDDPRAGWRRVVEDLSVRTKIVAAVLVAVLVGLAVGIITLRALDEASRSADRLYHSNVAGLTQIAQVETVVAGARTDAVNQLVSRDAAAEAQDVSSFNTGAQSFDAAVAAYRATDPAGDPAEIDALESDWRSFVQLAQGKLFPAGSRNDLAEWQQVRDAELTPLMTSIDRHVAALTAAETADAAKSDAAAKDDYRSSRTRSIVILAIGLVLSLGLGLLVAAAMVRALCRVEQVCDALAAGDLTRSSGLTSRDEPGRMGRALDQALERLRRTVSTIDASAATLANASEELTGAAAQIAVSAEETSTQAQTVSASAEQVSRSVEAVSAGSEQMGAAIREISQNATEAARVASDAVAITAATSTTMSQLGQSSAEIGNVIKVITSIAEQTNLLALNATIEAARAGEAGKGFAVVATEVKDLAQETARATEDISRRVQAIQTDTTGAVSAIEQITHVIAQISDFQTTIASAVEQQSATTDEMNRSVGEAASGVTEIAENITGVAGAVQLTSQGITESQQASAELARMSTELNGIVSTFRH